jgi:hypothetical protein
MGGVDAMGGAGGLRLDGTAEGWEVGAVAVIGGVTPEGATWVAAVVPEPRVTMP